MPPKILNLSHDNALYHVSHQARGQRKIFHDERYFAMFLRTLEEAHKHFGLEVHAYCLTDKNYHLLVKAPKDKLTRGLRHLNSLYTQRHNRLKGADGPLFNPQFETVLVDKDEFMLNVSRYIHRHPAETGKIPEEKLLEYPWSSLQAYIQKTDCPKWLKLDDCYAVHGYKRPHKAYQKFVKSGLDPMTREFYSKRVKPPIFGSEQLIDNLREQQPSKAAKQRLDKVQQRLPNIDEIVSTTARYFKCTKKSILVSQRGRGKQNVPRWYALYLCRHAGHHSLKDVAQHMGMKNISGVNHGMSCLKKLIAEDQAAKEDLDNIIQQLPVK